MPSLSSNRQESQKVLSKLVAQAWMDEEFKKRFISEPVAILAENGLTVPSDAQVRVNENAPLSTLASTDISSDSNGVYEIPLPSKPAELANSQMQFRTYADTSEGPALCA